jgi:hypothetical protein
VATTKKLLKKILWERVAAYVDLNPKKSMPIRRPVGKATARASFTPDAARNPTYESNESGVGGLLTSSAIISSNSVVPKTF